MRLKFLKLQFWFNYHIGQFTVNERKYDDYLDSLISDAETIVKLENKKA